jgi:hypothetical protein
LAAATEAMRANGEVRPMIIAHTGDTLFAVHLGDMMRSDRTKDIAAGMIGAEMRKSVTPAFYVFMSEAWLAVPKPGKNPREGPPPSERPDRIEALVLSASDGDGDTLVTYQTGRNAHGRSHH